MAKETVNQQALSFEHGWAETRNRHEQDQDLRQHGFRIHARPKGQEPTWRAPDGQLLPQAVALRRLQELRGDPNL